MPKYAFECQNCTVRFERVLKMGEHPTHDCPQCNNEAPRIFEGFGFAFGASSQAKSNANTGVHDLDYPSADKIVGRSAEDRWTTYREREKVKKQVRQHGNDNALTRKDGAGFVEYSGTTAQARKSREKVVDYAVQMERQPIVPKP